MSARTQQVVVSVSIGVASVDRPVSPTELLARADAAMYEAKRRGRGRVAVADVAVDELRGGGADVETGLRRALERDELVVEYEPILTPRPRISSARGARALAASGSRTTSRPASSSAIAEEIGLIAPIGRHVLREVCRQLARWRAGGDGGRPGVGQRVGRPADRRGGPARVRCRPSWRATSSTAAWSASRSPSRCSCRSTRRSPATLRRLRELGVAVAIDDFGTGYSSLAYVHRLPVDVVKIDKAFTDQVIADPTSRAVVRAVVDLSHVLALARSPRASRPASSCSAAGDVVRPRSRGTCSPGRCRAPTSPALLRSDSACPHELGPPV
jgi:hypothetical protein